MTILRRMWAIGACALLLPFADPPAQAEVLKAMTTCPGQGLCPFFELVLTPPKNWVEDKEASKRHKVQVMVPRGRTFGNADAAIYVKVSAKEKDQDLAEFARVSQERWRQSARDTKIDRTADVERTNGQQAFVSYRYENPSRPQQRFEAVSFAIDKDKDGNDFFLMVALTGMQKTAIDQAMASYQEFLRAH